MHHPNPERCQRERAHLHARVVQRQGAVVQLGAQSAQLQQRLGAQPAKGEVACLGHVQRLLVCMHM